MEGCEAYEQGREAYQTGKAETDCPFASEPGGSWSRSAWFNGYLDARTGDRLKAVFAKHGVQWP